MVRRLLDRDRAREARRQGRILDLLERRFAPMFRSEFNRVSRELITAYTVTGSVPPLPESHERKITLLYRRMCQMAIQAFGDRIFSQGKSIGLTLEHKSFLDVFERYATEYVAAEAVRQKITSVTETTRSNIIDIIDSLNKEDVSITLIGRELAKKIPGINRDRGVLIARTETHGAANYGADAAARETGLQLNKEWVTVADGRTRQEHVSADGQVVAMDQPFVVGGERLMFPGDPNGSASNVINCRCQVSHIVVD